MTAASFRLSLQPDDFARIARLVRDLAGISLPAEKSVLVRARLAKRLRTLGMSSFAAYAALLEGRDEAAAREREELISAITTNVTRFFREPHHFAHLADRVLPDLAERARRGGRVRLWSAGCSTGEEPYSMALTLLETLPEAARLDVRVLATDLDRSVLGIAERGVYGGRAMQSVPAALRARYFRQVTGAGGIAYAAGPALRALVAFRQLNLTLPWPMPGRFDVVFCRNVVIYFDAATERGVWDGLAERLVPGGWLYIGHSERIDTGALPAFESDGVSSYRRA